MRCLITVFGRTTVARRKTDNDSPLGGQLILLVVLIPGPRSSLRHYGVKNTPRPGICDGAARAASTTTTGASRSRFTDLALGIIPVTVVVTELCR